jgi:hypothetical protein
LTAVFVFVDHFANATTEATRANDDENDDTEDYPSKNFSDAFQFIKTLFTCEGSVGDSTRKIDISEVESFIELLVTFLKDHLKVEKSSVKRIENSYCQLTNKTLQVHFPCDRLENLVNTENFLSTGMKNTRKVFHETRS